MTAHGDVEQQAVDAFTVNAHHLRHSDDDDRSQASDGLRNGASDDTLSRPEAAARPSHLYQQQNYHDKRGTTTPSRSGLEIGTLTPVHGYTAKGSMSGWSTPAMAPGASGTATPARYSKTFREHESPVSHLSPTKEETQSPLEPQWKIVTWNVHGEQDLEKCPLMDPLDDPENPKSWPTWRRAMIIGIVVGCSICGTTCSSMAASGTKYFEREFSIGREVAALSVSLFVLALGLGPAFMGPMSEFHGRRIIYIICFGCFVLFNFPVAFANNPAVFFIFRFLTGLCTSAFLSVAGGSVHDMFPPAQSFEPMSIFSAGPFLGPVLGPLIFGFVNYFTDNYRWGFYVIIIWGFCLWLANLFLCPETLAPVILTKRAKKLRKQTRDPRWISQAELDRGDRGQLETMKVFLSRVPQLLSDPMMICLCIWSAFLLGLVYLFFSAVPFVMGLHDFNLWQSGLSYIGLMVGMLSAIASVPFWRRLYDRACADAGGKAPPEARLPMAMVGACCTCLGMYLFGLTSFKHIHWIGPIIALTPFGFGVLLVFISIFTFTGECWRSRAASALAVNALCRCTSAAAFPLFSFYMYNRMGGVGANLFLAGINTLMIPIPFVIYKYGARLRARSRYAET